MERCYLGLHPCQIGVACAVHRDAKAHIDHAAAQAGRPSSWLSLFLHRRTVDLNPAPSAFLCYGFPAILNILNEHHERPAIPPNIDHSYVVRTRPAGDFDDGVCGNSHSDSLAIDRADAQGVCFQSKAFASQHLG